MSKMRGMDIRLKGNFHAFPEPKVGDKIYVPGAMYVYRGEDDFAGGLATINKVERSETLPKGHTNYLFIGIEERPGSMYNWNCLAEKQEEYKDQYGDAIAHPDPDNDPEFNQPDEGWQSI